MQSAGVPTGRSRWIVTPTTTGNDALVGFIDSIRDDPAVSLVDTTPSTGTPHTAVIETDDTTVARLRQGHLNLKFEPDEPLSLYE